MYVYVWRLWALQWCWCTWKKNRQESHSRMKAWVTPASLRTPSWELDWEASLIASVFWPSLPHTTLLAFCGASWVRPNMSILFVWRPGIRAIEQLNLETGDDINRLRFYWYLPPVILGCAWLGQVGIWSQNSMATSHPCWSWSKIDQFSTHLLKGDHDTAFSLASIMDPCPTTYRPARNMMTFTVPSCQWPKGNPARSVLSKPLPFLLKKGSPIPQ